MGRIEKICSYIERSDTFADIGCDHGYCTRYALQSGMCGSAIIADISSKSLNKAEELLAPYIEDGRCRAVCCDGLRDIPRDIGQVLIAGMGGEEIIKILTEGFIPEKFIFQPMKNADKLRRFLLSSGCEITVDDIFKDGKFYFIIKGKREGNRLSYTAEEYAFGRDSLNNPVFRDYVCEELAKREAYLKDCGGDGYRKILNEIKFLTRVVK
ncbi:MAG: class I SAM-dependent methyltransferase [Clostridia bacterium]|nr:class I SAM-dependent methyltransferase [Clostridia bacterium]